MSVFLQFVKDNIPLVAVICVAFVGIIVLAVSLIIISVRNKAKTGKCDRKLSENGKTDE